MPGRDEDQCPAAGPKHPMEPGNGDLWMIQVLEDVDTDDRIEILMLEFHVEIRVLEVAGDPREVLQMAITVSETSHIRPIDVQRDDPLSIEQQRRQVARSAPRLEDTVSHRPVELPDRPARDLWRLPKALEGRSGDIFRRPRIDEPELDEQPERLQTVAPADRLALGVRPPVVRDGNLVDPRAGLRQPGRHLRLDPEALAPQPELLQHVGTDRLVARLHVRQVEVVQDVREPGEQTIAKGVPVQEDAAFRARGEPRSEHRIRAVLEDGLQEARELRGVVLEVRVLHDPDVAGHRGDACADRRTLPAIRRMSHDDDPLIAPRQLLEDLR